MPVWREGFSLSSGRIEEDHSPAPAARFVCNSSRKGAKDAKDAKGKKKGLLSDFHALHSCFF